ncbi:MAG: M15 family peptidase, partial [Acidimicrobiia bacterium]
MIARRRSIVIFALALAGCSAAGAAPDTPSTVATTATTTTTTTTTLPASTTTVPPSTTTVSPFARPAWLGTRVLPLGPDGENGIAQPTPLELQNRQLETIDLLSPPPDDQFVSTIEPVPDDVIARSTWTEDCPVTRDELAYINVSFYGFDGKFHTGET